MPLKVMSAIEVPEPTSTLSAVNKGYADDITSEKVIHVVRNAATNSLNWSTGKICCITSTQAVNSIRLLLPPTESMVYDRLYTYEAIIRLQNKSSSTNQTVSIQFLDDEEEDTITFLDGESTRELERGYSYLFVFRNIPSFYSNSNATTMNETTTNVRQWVGNLQGKVLLPEQP